MTVTPYQIVVPIVSAFTVAYAWHLVYIQKKTIWEGVLWTLFWGAVAYVAVFPNQMRFLSDITGIRRNENAIIVTAIGILFFIIFYLVIRIEELEQRLARFIRQEALKDLPDSRDGMEERKRDG